MSQNSQTWNNILNYIKRNLGAKLNLIELTDDEIIDGLREDVLPYFSQFTPRKKFTIITEKDKFKLDTSKGQPRYAYRLDTDEPVIDILDVYYCDTSIVSYDLSTLVYDSYSAMDLVIQNTMMDYIRSMGTRQTWEWIPPDMLIFDKELIRGKAVVVYNVAHTKLEEMLPDLYQILFKPLCLANVKIWLARLRSKYETMGGPFGQINMNWSELEQQGLNEKQEIENKLYSLPPDRLVYLDLM